MAEPKRQGRLEAAVIIAYWRDTARSFEIRGINGFILLPVIIFLLHIRWWSFGCLIVTIIALKWLDTRGYTPPVAVRALKTMLGPKTVKRMRSLGTRSLWR
jgi:intracellular multiplication protein IcmT